MSWSPDVFEESQSLEKRSTTWNLGGSQVCLAVFVHLLGTSQRTLWNQIRAEPDGRRSRKNLHAKSDAVEFFFYELYMSAAEPLPSDPKCRVRAGNTVDADITYDGSPWYCVGDPLNPEDELEDPAIDPLQDWNPDKPAGEVIHQLTVASQSSCPGVPTRWLGHGRLHDLYWLFCAAWSTLLHTWEQP